MSEGEATAAPEPRPNIVFILADDLGWSDLGCMGSKYYETPNIDRLAAEGMRLMNYHNCQNCTPTRAALMSGQYPPRTGVYTVGSLERGKAAQRKMLVPENRTQLPRDRKTIANQLRTAGYATGMFGKWHLGSGDHHPAQRGFDEAIVTRGRHFGFRTDPMTDYEDGTYLADFLTGKAVEFIERHKDRPFFLYLPHFAVHSPYQAKPELIAKYEKKRGADGHTNAVYAAMIESIDQSVGRVIEKLAELGLAGKTVVIFSSDNGGVGSYSDTGGKGVTDNAPLRGGKGTLYEGGVRVPFIVRWPGMISAGTTSDEPAIHVDLFPTFMELGDVDALVSQTLDGESLVPLWRDPGARLKREAIYAHFPGYLEGYGTPEWRTTPAGTIQMGSFKLLEFFEDGRLELYDLSRDLGERHNLVRERPGKAGELQRRLAAWREEIGAAMPRAKTN